MLLGLPSATASVPAPPGTAPLWTSTSFDNHVSNHFYAPKRGPNVWEYYFEPVMGVSYEEIRKGLASGALSPDQLHSFRDEQVLNWHHADPNRLATFWADDEPVDRAVWMAGKRALGRCYVRKFVRVRAHILAKVDHFYHQFIAQRHTLGVHIRGTDFSYAEPTRLEEYLQAIHSHVRQRNLDEYQIFLATDQTQFVERFRAVFGDRIVVYECHRSSNHLPAFHSSTLDPYLKGEEALIDVLLLSRCRFLFKGAAAAGEYTMWFNDQLECVDLALRSDFDPRPFEQLATAYSKLDVDNCRSRPVGWLLRFKQLVGIPYFTPAWHIPRLLVRRVQQLTRGRSVRRRFAGLPIPLGPALTSETSCDRDIATLMCRKAHMSFAIYELEPQSCSRSRNSSYQFSTTRITVPGGLTLLGSHRSHEAGHRRALYSLTRHTSPVCLSSDCVQHKRLQSPSRETGVATEPDPARPQAKRPRLSPS